MSNSASSVRRIFKEWRQISERTRETLDAGDRLAWGAHPVHRDQPYEWHFTVRGPDDSAFSAGMYHGRLVLPPQYPLQPPSIYFMTMNGRFDIGKPICLSVTQYHPEEWQPAWGIASILDALQAFFPTPPENAAYSLDWSDGTREKLAAQSVNYRCPTCGKSNRELLSQGHPFIDDEESPNEDTREQQDSPVIDSPSEDIPGGDNTNSLDTYSLWTSIPLLIWYLLIIMGQGLSKRHRAAAARWTKWDVAKAVFKAVSAVFCLYKIYVTFRSVTADLWIVQDFPIYRPGQVSVLGENFKLSKAETTAEFYLHPWLRFQ